MKDKSEHIKKSIKLDEIDKKVVYKVPDDYFEKLPTIIQSRVVKPETASTPVLSWASTINYALPVAAIFIVIFYLVTGTNNSDGDVQAMIEEVSTEELVAYLDESDLSTDELLSLIDLNEFDVDGLLNEDIELLNEEEWDELLNEYPDFENEI